MATKKVPTAEVLKHLNELYEFAVKCAKDYEATGKSSLPDEEFDALLRQIRRMVRVNHLESHRFPVAFEAVVGAGPTPIRERGNKIQHVCPMYSLKKIYEIRDFTKWLSGIIAKVHEAKVLDDGVEPNVSIEYKLDGHAVQLVYIYGKLCTVVTRGDGEYGDDITNRAIQIPDLPNRLDCSGAEELLSLVVVDGEIYADDKGLAGWIQDPNCAGHENPKDARAMVSMFRGESAKGIEKYMRFNPHQLTEIKHRSEWDYGDLNLHESHRDRLKLLEMWGFKRVTPISYARNNLAAELQVLMHSVATHREQLGFPIDGIVIAFDSVTIRQLMGHTQDDPRWAIAFKFPAVEHSARVVGIEWNVSMNGDVVPTLLHTPVNIGKRRFSRVSIHNHSYLRALGLLRNNQSIKVALRGDVTPVFMGTETPDSKTGDFIHPPTSCPSCSNTLKVQKVHLKCDNLGCIDQMVKRLIYYSKDEFSGIRGWNNEGFKGLLLGIPYQFQSPFEIYRYLDEGSPVPKHLTSAALIRLRSELRLSLLRDFIQLFSGAVSGLLTPKELKWVKEQYSDWEQFLETLTKPPLSDPAHQVFEKLKPINKDLRLIGAAVATKGVGFSERAASILL